MEASPVAIVTGAAGGIGSKIVQRLLAREYRVAAVDRSPAGLETLGQHVTRDVFWSGVFDLGDPALAQRCVSQTFERWGRVDALVTCAGLFAQTPVPSIEPQLTRDLLTSNLESVIHLVAATTRRMARSGGGRMVHVSSIAAECGGALASVYAAAKAGVVALVKSHARELAPFGIRVNAVLPGYCDTPMLDPARAMVERFIVPRIPLKRLAQPDEIAEVVEFLLTCKTGYLTGAAIPIDGGLHVG